MKKKRTNTAVSVHQKLLRIAKSSDKFFNAILLRYFQERFLYRLSISSYRESFVLKGALLLLAFDIQSERPTKDIDFLGVTTPEDEVELIEDIKSILSIQLDDGIVFDGKSIEVQNIRKEELKKGVRVFFRAFLGKANTRMHIDIGSGDRIIPDSITLDFPVLLDEMPIPNLLAYNAETAIAEKYEAIVNLGFTTSRMKDFYDIYYLIKHHNLNLEVLKEAIIIVFQNRGTDINKRHLIYTEEYVNDAINNKQWESFIKRIEVSTKVSFGDCIESIKGYIEGLLS